MLSLCTDTQPSKSTIKRWLLIIALAKICWLVLFIALRSDGWSHRISPDGVALMPLEYEGYYDPLESLIQTGHYDSVCRMPGLLPFYLPLRLVFSVAHAWLAMIVLHVLFDIVATLALGLLAARIFQSVRAAHFTWLLACVSTFTVVRNNYLLSDSLCISLSILSLFSFSSYLLSSKKKYLILSGIAMCIALFLRPVMLALFPGLCLLLAVHHGNIKSALRSSFVLILPSVLALGLWTAHNRITTGRTIVLIAPLGECMRQITPDFAAIREWIIASGGDFQPWAVGGESHWFFDSDKQLPMPFEADDFTPGVDTTMLLSLKHDYHVLHSDSLSQAEALQLEQSIIERGNACTQSYIRAHPLRYYVLNKVKFAWMILYPARIDDLPFPAFAQMNIAQKAIKIWSMLLLLAVNTLALIATLFWALKRKPVFLLWMCIPMGLMLLHACMGFVEQRYLAGSYPFYLMLIGGFLGGLFEKSTTNMHSLRQRKA